MAVGELVVHDIERVLLPLALFVLPVPHFHTIEVGLADVVQGRKVMEICMQTSTDIFPPDL